MLRQFLFRLGGRKFLHAGYVITLLLVGYLWGRHAELLEASQWDTTVGAIWKISGAFLGAHALDEAGKWFTKCGSPPPPAGGGER